MPPELDYRMGKRVANRKQIRNAIEMPSEAEIEVGTGDEGGEREGQILTERLRIEHCQAKSYSHSL